MREFPPSGQDQVTLANWRAAPFSSWAFSHVREIIPTAEIANNPSDIWQLETDLQDLSGLTIDDDMDLSRYLEATYTDGFTILHNGQIVCEEYRNAAGPFKPHILMSVSKPIFPR